MDMNYFIIYMENYQYGVLSTAAVRVTRRLFSDGKIFYKKGDSYQNIRF